MAAWRPGRHANNESGRPEDCCIDAVSERMLKLRPRNSCVSRMRSSIGTSKQIPDTMSAPDSLRTEKRSVRHAARRHGELTGDAIAKDVANDAASPPARGTYRSRVVAANSTGGMVIDAKYRRRSQRSRRVRRKILLDPICHRRRRSTASASLTAGIATYPSCSSLSVKRSRDAGIDCRRFLNA
jgi:hypothetical protein